MGKMENVHLVALRIDLAHVPRGKLSGPTGDIRNGHSRRSAVEAHRIAAVEHHRGSVREYVEHALAAPRVDEMYLIMTLAPFRTGCARLRANAARKRKRRRQADEKTTVHVHLLTSGFLHISKRSSPPAIMSE